MYKNNLSYFPEFLSTNAINGYFIVFLLCTAFFFQRSMQLLWIFFGLVEVITFFWFTYFLSIRWRNISDVIFQRKLFNTALVIRVIYVIFSWFFFKLMTGKPFEFDAADSTGYHEEALWIIDLFKAGMLDYYFSQYAQGFSDSGWPILLSVIYFFSFKSIFVSRLVNALLSAWMVVMIYRLSQRNFGNYSARITAIMAMLFPIFIYYSGMHLKETAMVFFLLAFIERADYIIRSRTFTLWNIITIVVLGFSLFFFRTVLAAAAWFSVLSALLFSSTRLINRARRLVHIVWFIIAIMFVFSGTILTEVEGYFYERTYNQQLQMEKISLSEGGNKLAQYGRTSIFAPIMIFAPLPTLVNTNQPNANMINGNLYVRNVIAFFVLIALWVLFQRRSLSRHVLILVILFSYLAILSASGFALSERFHMPALPFLIMLAGYGITNMNRRFVNLYIPYLIVISVVIIAWNWFKLAGRGMI